MEATGQPASEGTQSIFGVRISPWAWSSLIRLGYWSASPKDRPCHRLPRAGIACVHHHAQLFMWELKVELGPHR